MENIVQAVYTDAKIVFSNGLEYNIPFKNDNSQSEDLETYCTSCSLKESLYKSDNTSIIGNVCSNLLTIEIMSNNRELISSNKQSTYYGYMNNSAIIYISITGSDNVVTNMGRYYVDAWENGASSDDYAKITITASSIMERLKNIGLGRVNIRDKIKFSEYITGIIDIVNKKISKNMRILYDTDEVKKLDNIYGDDWQMWFNNIEHTDIESVFNTLAKNTLSYIWIDRNNYLKIDCLLDDKKEKHVCELSGSTNLFSYSVHDMDVYNYNGVNTKYINSVRYSDTELLSMNEIELDIGNQTINAKLNNTKVKDVHHIEIITNNGKAVCTKFYYYRDYIKMTINSNMKTIASINIFGKVINESYDEIAEFSGTEEGALLNVENLILRGASKIRRYTKCYNKLIHMKNANIQVEGYINPQVKLGDMVNVTGQKLDIASNYKVIELEFTLGSNYRCKASLIKTANSDL